ncbi:ABC transporter permease [Ruminococcus sp. Marseille-P6503]|uniref:ABC transporter permease n=1 Tax=Ruminococcus sp. Marseille-P6503 TaxID=2364796 RepID=UPI0013DE65A6|nr:ABC transporter permease [Ruminococcus sp. Marseille-P6503]
MTLKYAAKQLKRRPLATILVIFQFAVTTLLIGMILEKASGYFVTSSLIKDVCLGDSYYLQYDISYQVELDDRLFELSCEFDEELQPYADKLDNGEITREEYDSVLAELNEKYDKIREEENLNECFDPIDVSDLPYVEKNYAFYYTNLICGNDYIKCLSSDYCSGLNFKMKEGRWLSEAKKSDDYINLVMFSGNEYGYKVGDVVDIKLETYISKGNMGIANLDLKGKIVGLIDYSHYKEVVEHGSFESSDYLSLDDLLPIKSYDVFAEYSPDLFKSISEKYVFEPDRFAQSVKLKENITEEEKNEFFSAATSKKYQYTDLNQAYQNTYIRDKKNMRNDMVFLTIASLIAIVSLIGISALSVSKEIKTYSIYCLNGMTRKQCIGINAAYISLLALISVCIAFAVKFIYGYLNYFKMYTDISAFRSEAVAKETVRLSYYFSVGSTEAAAVIILLCVAFASAMIIPYITLKKLDIIQNIKENG